MVEADIGVVKDANKCPIVLPNYVMTQRIGGVLMASLGVRSRNISAGLSDGMVRELSDFEAAVTP